MLPISELIRIGSFDRRIREKVGLELRASWPFPDRRLSAVVIFYYQRYSRPPAELAELFPPTWEALISVEGDIISLDLKTPSDYGIGSPPDVPFAKHGYPRDWSRPSISAIRSDLETVCDQLYPAFLRGVASQSEILKQPRRRFCELFPDWAPRPMLVCYRAVSPEFYSWTGLDG